LAARARPCAARSRLFQLIARHNRALRAPPAHRSFAAYYSTPKNKLNLWNFGRPHPGLFSFHGTTEAMKYEVPCPCPNHRSFADPFGNILGSKCTGATIRPNFFRFFLFCIAFGFFLFVILFFFFSPF
jgi:hypothetical protein